MNINETIYEECNGIQKEEFKTECIGLKGIWALYGKNENSEYECLNVGKSQNIGDEIVFDLGCYHFIPFREDGTKLYINQSREYCGFKYKPRHVQEYLYPYIASKYSCIKFVYVGKENDMAQEKKYAEKNHAVFWRNGRPYESVLNCETKT